MEPCADIWELYTGKHKKKSRLKLEELAISEQRKETDIERRGWGGGEEDCGVGGGGEGVCLVSKTLGSFSECESGMGQIRNVILAVCSSRTVFEKPEYLQRSAPDLLYIVFLQYGRNMYLPSSQGT